MSPTVVDTLELWELAAALGANRAEEVDPDRTDDTGYTWNQRRAIALETGAPEPSWDDVPMTAAEIDAQRRLMAAAPQIGGPGA